uniref:Uncharacterized protein n=1 Tax=Opuntia streptacantha TaxID=393608 RepID=A0A7C9DXF1_OPUST
MEKFDGFGFGFGFDGNDNSFSALLQNGDSGAPYLEILNMFREVVKSEIQASNRETRSSVNSELAKINEQLEMIRNCLLSSKSSSLPSCSRSLLKQGNSSASRILKLRFEGSLPKRLFTCKSLREQGASLKVLLCDTCGVAIEEGPESSITVKIVVLNGDFTPDDRNDSTGKEFNANVLRKRDGKRPLLVGKCEIPLRKGVVSIDDVMFTDNSSWMRSGKFRFGAKATKNVPSGVVISEAISDDFEVKERRGESNQKRETPLLDDEIWRLHNIRKNGPVHVRLQGASVHLVKDFLRLYDANEDSLKKIVRVSDSKWQVIIEHAKRALTVEPSECCNYAHRVSWVLNVFLL